VSCAPGFFTLLPHPDSPYLMFTPDLSICPSNVGSNTASVALIIGEKCAELIEGDLRE